MYPDLKAKRVLITGASGGLGAAMAKAFGGCGARVVVHYRSRSTGANATREAVEHAGGEACVLRADLRSETQLTRLAEQALACWDGLDILVNNAGIVLKSSALDAGAAHWNDSFAINARAPYLLSRLIARHWIDRGQAGCILHNSSIHAVNSTQWFGVYAASKAALEAMSKVMALEWAPHAIRVNCIAPGVVPVERTAETLRQTEDLWLPHIPAGRFGAPEDIARMALHLCSEAAAWITGQSFAVDGGMLARIDMPRRPPPPTPETPEAPDPDRDPDR